MIPAEQARAEVEAWRASGSWHDDLIARLVPVYERACATGVRLEPDGPTFSTEALNAQITALRKRAEGAEAAYDHLVSELQYQCAARRSAEAEVEMWKTLYENAVDET